jgi:RNA polymerase sigma-70 factor, ECF subfamily
MNENVDKREEISLEKLKSGDREALARLVEENSTQIYRVALKILGDAQDAEDVLQETFIKAMRALPTFEGRSSLSTWLYRIAANEALMIVRKRRPDPVSIDAGIAADENEAEAEPVEIVDWCCLPEGDFMTAEARQFLDQAAQRLTPALRAVFVLRDVEGLSVKETADALEISEAAVKTRLLRARLKLREELSVYFAERVSERSIDE